MKSKNISKLNRLIIKLVENRSKYHSSIEAIRIELESLTGKEIVCNDFTGDGLGVAVGVDGLSRGNTYMSLADAKALILEKGTIDADDFTYL